MIQKDYIMQIIEQMGKVLAKVILNKDEGNHEEAIKNIDDAFGETFGVDHRLLKSLSIDDIANLFGFSKDHSMGSLKCLLVGRLLKEKANLMSEIGNEESQDIYHKALGVYLKGILNIGYTEMDLTRYYEDVKDIERILKGRLATDEMFFLFQFFGNIKEYTKAEDYLFHLKNVNYPDIRNVGLSFLKNLKLIDEIELEKCNLTSNEINEAINEFEKV